MRCLSPTGSPSHESRHPIRHVVGKRAPPQDGGHRAVLIAASTLSRHLRSAGKGRSASAVPPHHLADAPDRGRSSRHSAHHQPCRSEPRQTQLHERSQVGWCRCSNRHRRSGSCSRLAGARRRLTGGVQSAGTRSGNRTSSRDRANTGFQSRICSHRVCWSRARGLSERGGLARRGRCAIGRRDSTASVRVGSGFNAREARRCCSNTSEEGVKTAGLKTLRLWGPRPVASKMSVRYVSP